MMIDDDYDSLTRFDLVPVQFSCHLCPTLPSRAINVDIANGDNGGNSRAFTSNSFSPILPVKITSFWSHKWLDQLYWIRILGKIRRGI